MNAAAFIRAAAPWVILGLLVAVFAARGASDPAVHHRQLNVQKRIKLLSTDLSIAEVSEWSGYGDYRVFTKVFKKSEGVTPSQYRRDFLEK